MNVSQFCRIVPKVHQLIAIRLDGYIVAINYIDYEDLCSCNFSDRKVLKHENGYLPIKVSNGNSSIKIGNRFNEEVLLLTAHLDEDITISVPCVYVDISNEIEY